MTRLLIVGAGGHGKVVSEAALESGRWQEIAFLDARFPELSHVLHWPVIGTDSEAVRFLPAFPEIFVAIGDNKLRAQFMDALHSAGFMLPAVVHRMAWVSPSAQIGPGSLLVAGTVVNAGAVLGQGCIVNTGATVDHDCQLGNCVHVAPGAHVGGDSVIGARTWIGIGAAVRHGVKIGADVMVGAGAAVVEDLAEGVTAIGVPARVV